MNQQLAILHDRLTQPGIAQHAFIACAGLTLFVHIAFLAPTLFFLARAGIHPEAGAFEDWLDRHATAMTWLPAGATVVLFLFMRPAPHDDLLAISAIATGAFSHASFAYSTWGMQPASPWFGYEKLVGYLAHQIGTNYAILVFQIVAVGLTAASVTMAIRKRMRFERGHVLLALLLIGLVLASMTIGRAVNARVESLFFAWAIAALWLPPWGWLALGLLLAPLYWLAWIYAPAALLLKGSWRTRILAGTAYALVCVLLWMVITGGRYPEMFALTATWLSRREATVMENVPLLQGLPGSPAALALLVVAGWLAIRSRGKREDLPLAIVAIWFALPDMVRYLPIIATLSAVWIMTIVSRGDRLPSGNAMLATLLIPLGVAYATALPAGRIENLPRFDVPRNSVVLGPLESGLYATIHFNRDIKAAPSFEIGATDPTIQKAAQKLDMGQFDCGLLRFYAIDYVVENNLKTVPVCLKLSQVQGPWRLWKTRNPTEEVHSL